MAEVHLQKTTGWFYNSYKCETTKKQSADVVNQAIEKVVWQDKNDTYRVIKLVGLVAAPALASLVNPTSFSMYSWVTPELVGLSTMVFAIPHEVLFNANSYISGSARSGKSIGTLGVNAAIESATLMVISTLAQDYLKIPRWATYSALGLTCGYFKAQLNLYESVWPETSNLKVKVTKK